MVHELANPDPKSAGVEVAERTVEVIVPHVSRWDLLERLLESIDGQSRPPAVCVVDNASTDDSVARLALRNDVRVLALDENVGFGRAINAGVMSSEAELVIFLNNDMVLDPEFVAEVCTALEESDCAVASLQLDEGGRIDTIGVGCDQSLDAYDVGHGSPTSEAVELSSRVLGPSGGAAGFRRATFVDLGGYDEAIFAYLEDLDLAIRLRHAAIPTHFVPTAVVHHLHSATLGSGSSRKNELLGWSRGYIVWKYRASVRAVDRVRGLLIDLIVYSGKLLVDRNVGAFRGRIQFARDHEQLTRSPKLDIPVTRESIFSALARRLARR